MTGERDTWNVKLKRANKQLRIQGCALDARAMAGVHGDGTWVVYAAAFEALAARGKPRRFVGAVRVRSQETALDELEQRQSELNGAIPGVIARSSNCMCDEAM